MDVYWDPHCLTLRVLKFVQYVSTPELYRNSRKKSLLNDQLEIQTDKSNISTISLFKRFSGGFFITGGSPGEAGVCARRDPGQTVHWVSQVID